MSFLCEGPQREGTRFSGDSVTDPEAGVPNALDVAAWPEDHMVLADFGHLSEETPEENSGWPGEDSMSQKHFSSNPGTSVDLKGKYC